MTNFENLTSEQRLRASLHRDVQALAQETCHFIGLSITKPAMDMLLDIFFHKITCYAEDLEAFARSGRRFIINGDDVRIIARRGRSLKTRLQNAVSSKKSKEGGSKEDDGESSKEASKRRNTLGNLFTSAKRAKTQEDFMIMKDDEEKVTDLAKE